MSPSLSTCICGNLCNGNGAAGQSLPVAVYTTDIRRPALVEVSSLATGQLEIVLACIVATTRWLCISTHRRRAPGDARRASRPGHRRLSSAARRQQSMVCLPELAACDSADTGATGSDAAGPMRTHFRSPRCRQEALANAERSCRDVSPGRTSSPCATLPAPERPDRTLLDL